MKASAPPEPPDAGSQACPRSLRLLPDRLPIPAATLAILLRRSALRLEYSGWGLLPAVPDGSIVEVASGIAPRRGDLALVRCHGRADLLRLLRPVAGGGWVALLDGYPRHRVTLDPGAILGVATRVDGRPPRRVRALTACRAGYGAFRLALRRVSAAPVWEEAATDTVLGKYASQVDGYLEARQSNLTPEHLDRIGAHAGPGGCVLVAGCGVGSEALHLARLGYRVVGFDALDDMIATARRLAAGAGLALRFESADARRGDWPEGPYDAVYMTPLLYSFVWGRPARVTFLRRLGQGLRPGGGILYSARLH
ncbi:MAG TPA: class I SAM-dependent methyltransferase, partial [Candidatus Polarisedimenticolia bacterium]|nr:class I SAM-dependent methyltransferase [Candidatus Polarisedimenticolia bacterium]